jgi:hypothetical protein
MLYSNATLVPSIAQTLALPAPSDSPIRATTTPFSLAATNESSTTTSPSAGVSEAEKCGGMSE